MALNSAPVMHPILEVNIGSRAGGARVLLLDGRLPMNLTMPFRVPQDIRSCTRDLNWFENLQKSVTRPGRKVRDRETVRDADELLIVALAPV
jgi:hypothetical protein